MEKKKLRFTIEDNLNLLREVLASNSFEDFDKWKEIAVKIIDMSGK